VTAHHPVQLDEARPFLRSRFNGRASDVAELGSATADLPIPEVIEIGAALGGAYAISETAGSDGDAAPIGGQDRAVDEACFV
jgi:hypothetical protein